jgi:hypothetical protein
MLCHGIELHHTPCDESSPGRNAADSEESPYVLKVQAGSCPTHHVWTIYHLRKTTTDLPQMEKIACLLKRVAEIGYNYGDNIPEVNKCLGDH